MKELTVDFRTKVFMTLVISTICVMGGMQKSRPHLSLVIGLLPLVFLAAGGKYAAFAKDVLIITGGWLMQVFLLERVPVALSSLVLLISGIVLRMVPGALMGFYALTTTSMSDMAASLRRMKTPDFIIIPVSVMFRFFYSVSEDYRIVSDTMKMNGLTLRRCIKTPGRYMEYKMVPLLMCSVKSADDVAISAMSRGLRVGAPRSSISRARLKALDWALILCFSVLLALNFI